MQWRRHIIVRIALIVLATLTWGAPARADIELSPLRHVITRDARSATFTVSNPSSRIVDARISWVDLSATAQGYEPAEPKARAVLSAAPYLTVSPAHFRLEPGARTTVTVALKKGTRIPRGERRSHLLFETAAARTSIRKASQNGMQIDIGVGVSAPVLLRNGARTSAEIDDARLIRTDDGAIALVTSIRSKGAISPYGRLVAAYRTENKMDDAPAPWRILGERANVAGYLDVRKREFEIPLGVSELSGGELELRYEGAAEFSGRRFDARIFKIEPAQ
ncbi:MAG: hypothetical protein AAGA09_03450 [Pseudomonadota bacterium]